MIFLSYASEDYQAASRLYDYLRSNDLNVWMDKKAIQPGQEWEPQIWRAASTADFFCLLLSKRSVTKRGFIRKEMRFALDKWKEKLPEDVYLIPCRIDDVDPPVELKHLQYTNLRTDTDHHELVDLLVKLEGKLERQELVNFSEPYVQKSESWKTDGLEVDLKYPEFSASDLHSLNSIIARKVDELREDAKQFDGEPTEGETKSFYECGFGVYRPSEYVISVLFVINSYGSGAAHPNSSYSAINFNRVTRRSFSLSEAFANPNEAIQIVSNACRYDLLKQRTLLGVFDDDTSANWIADGAGLKWENFQNCIFHDDQLQIYFSPYSVGPYIWGPRIVSIALTDIQDHLNPNLPLSQQA